MAATTRAKENKLIARRVPEEVVTEGNIGLVDELFAENVIDHSPLGEMRGREAVKEQVEYIRAAFADPSATVEDVIAEGDTVAMRVTVRGTHEGEFMDVEPTGREFEIENMVFTRIEDGQIIERWVRPDTLGLMQQIGVVEPPGE